MKIKLIIKRIAATLLCLAVIAVNSNTLLNKNDNNTCQPFYFAKEIINTK